MEDGGAGAAGTEVMPNTKVGASEVAVTTGPKGGLDVPFCSMICGSDPRLEGGPVGTGIGASLLALVSVPSVDSASILTSPAPRLIA